jgi:hypothetical protein
MRYGQPNAISSYTALIHTPIKQDIITYAQSILWEPISVMRAGLSCVGKQSDLYCCSQNHTERRTEGVGVHTYVRRSMTLTRKATTLQS